MPINNTCGIKHTIHLNLDNNLDINVDVVPYFSSLEQIDAALQHWASKEYLLKAIQNSIQMGYKITK